MIYLSNTTDAQVAYVPRDVEIPSGTTLTFKMRSTVDLDIVLTALVIDTQMHRIYYNVALSLPEDTTPGEYQYYLDSDGETISTGLLVVRDNGADVTEYNNEIQYEQYQS